MTEKENVGTEIKPFDPADDFRPEESMEGVEPRLPKIEVIHKMQMFMLEGEEDPTKFIDCVIIDSNKTNAWWEKSMEEGGAGNIPDCYSYNAVYSDPSSNIRQNDSCLTCKQMKRGTGKNGQGTACKKMRRVHLLINGRPLPYRLTLTISSFKAFDDYVTGLAASKTNYWYARTQLTLEKAENKAGIEYSKVSFKNMGKMDSAADAQMINKMRTDMVIQMRGASIEGDETSSGRSNVNDHDSGVPAGSSPGAQVDPF